MSNHIIKNAGGTNKLITYRREEDSRIDGTKSICDFQTVSTIGETILVTPDSGYKLKLYCLQLKVTQLFVPNSGLVEVYLGDDLVFAVKDPVGGDTYGKDLGLRFHLGAIDAPIRVILPWSKEVTVGVDYCNSFNFNQVLP